MPLSAARSVDSEGALCGPLVFFNETSERPEGIVVVRRAVRDSTIEIQGWRCGWAGLGDSDEDRRRRLPDIDNKVIEGRKRVRRQT